jgi:hypothetical protein
MAKFFLALIAFALALLVGAYVLAAFTLEAAAARPAGRRVFG